MIVYRTAGVVRRVGGRDVVGTQVMGYTKTRGVPFLAYRFRLDGQDRLLAFMRTFTPESRQR